MAKIWPVYEGNRPTNGWPWAELPLSEAISLFELQPSDLISDLKSTPRFGAADRDLTFAGFKHIVVEVKRNEVRQSKWKSGFYRSRIAPTEAFGRLIRQALTSELGAKNVVQVDWEPAIDSQGDAALRIRVVIAPDATQRLKGAAPLNALVSLRQRLREMREERTPIIEYVTESELKQSAGSQS